MFSLFELAKTNLIGKNLCLFVHSLNAKGKPGAITRLDRILNHIYLEVDTLPLNVFRKIVDVRFIEGEYDQYPVIRLILDSDVVWNSFNPSDISNYIDIQYSDKFELG